MSPLGWPIGAFHELGSYLRRRRVLQVTGKPLPRWSRRVPLHVNLGWARLSSFVHYFEIPLFFNRRP
jgi:hypothetical protein